MHLYPTDAKIVITNSKVKHSPPLGSAYNDRRNGVGKKKALKKLGRPS